MIPFLALLLPIWTIPNSYGAGSVISIQMLDTFSNHVVLTANVPINVEIITLWSDVPIANYSGTQIDFWFNLSRGCNAYVGTISSVTGSAFSLTPDQTAVYDPTPYATGMCNATSSSQFTQQDAFISLYEPIAKKNPLVLDGLIGRGIHTDIQWAWLGWTLCSNPANYQKCYH